MTVQKDSMLYPEQEAELIYALDIGTRSIIGMLGHLHGDRVEITAIEKLPHARRAMLDGQIEDIAQVASGVRQVTARLEQQCGRHLARACVAAAGRSLRTENGNGELTLSGPQIIREETLGRLEAAAVADAEQKLLEDGDRQKLFLVGYSVSAYVLDGYPMTSLLDHRGERIEVSVVATFLPGAVIDSLYAVMEQAGLEVASLTLEPIAALNAAIPENLRLLNLALIDIGAGTSDIAICREGSVVGYTMATVAGDEITEALMRSCLVDYPTAEAIKAELAEDHPITYNDILGIQQTAAPQEIEKKVESAIRTLVEELAEQVRKLNGGPPSALFLAGGGGKLVGLCSKLADALGMDQNRVAMAGAYFKNSAFSQTEELNDPEYTTPLGIAISAGLGLISDSCQIQLNGKPARLFRSGSIPALELLMMNGYSYEDIVGRNGKSLSIYVDGKRTVFYGIPSTPAQLTINGENTSVAALVQAGDQVLFTPAASGCDAAMTAGALAETHQAIGVMIGGETVPPETELKQGDRAELIYEGPSPQAEEAGVSDQKTVSANKPEQDLAKSGETIQLQLNGRILSLPAKPNGQPYYLMDLLELTGLDFKHLDRPVQMSVNGSPGMFQQMLREKDEVEIRCEEEAGNGLESP